MTKHEQKPESAEFRTREAQCYSLAALIQAGLPITHEKCLELAEKEIIEAEARGAAEQRRKDEEGGGSVARAAAIREGERS